MAANAGARVLLVDAALLSRGIYVSKAGKTRVFVFRRAKLYAQIENMGRALPEGLLELVEHVFTMQTCSVTFWSSGDRPLTEAHLTRRLKDLVSQLRTMVRNNLKKLRLQGVHIPEGVDEESFFIMRPENYASKDYECDDEMVRVESHVPDYSRTGKGC